MPLVGGKEYIKNDPHTSCNHNMTYPEEEELNQQVARRPRGPVFVITEQLSDGVVTCRSVCPHLNTKYSDNQAAKETVA